jgi:DNA-binding GntR family transcriptional regulator
MLVGKTGQAGNAPVQIHLPVLDAPRPPTVADQLFEALYRQVMTLELPPGARLSEVEVARRFKVSRQPVRDAFWRLSQFGFLLVRPQRATTVTQISERAVMQARFVRTALEVETLTVAADRLGPAELAELEGMLEEQAEAVAAEDRERFHRLDDDFHRRICQLAGVPFVWAMIREQKAHMDRVRYLSLSFGAELALNDHRAILAALRAGDGVGATAALRLHLSRIGDIIARIRAEHADYFAEDPEEVPAEAG